MQTKSYTLIGRLAFQAYMIRTMYDRFEDKPLKEYRIDDLIAIGNFGIATALLWQPHLLSPSNLLGRGLVRAWPLYAGWGLGVVVGAPISYGIAGKEGVVDFMEVATLQVSPTEYNQAIEEGFGGWSGIGPALHHALVQPVVDYAVEEIVEPVGEWFSDAWRDIEMGVATAQAEINKAKVAVIQASTSTVMTGVRLLDAGISFAEREWKRTAWKPWYLA